MIAWEQEVHAATGYGLSLWSYPHDVRDACMRPGPRIYEVTIDEAHPTGSAICAAIVARRNARALFDGAHRP